MSGAYIPPSKRANYVPTPGSLPPGQRSSSGPDLDSLFLAARTGTLNYFDGSRETSESVTGGSKDSSNSSSTPLLAYMVGYNAAHPAWESQRELWSHTNSDWIITDWAGEKRNFNRPIPYFDMRRTPGIKWETPVFQGWWILSSVTKVESREDLAEMMQRKEESKGFPRSGRTRDAWSESMSHTWVRLHFKPVPDDHPHKAALLDPTKLTPGEAGKLVLKVGGLEQEASALLAAGSRPGSQGLVKPTTPSTTVSEMSKGP